MRCGGYRQGWEMLEGRLPARELAERGIFATRQFAKRQLTWLRAFRDAGVIDHEFDLESALGDAQATARILSAVESHLKHAPRANA
jgi:tRNA dimethylallyltransferase